MQYTVTVGDKTTTYEASPEMEAAFKALKEWDGWCKCGNPSKKSYSMNRGHTCDVFCNDCHNVLQIG